MVYINSVKVHLPSSLGDLSATDLQRIADNNGSPYTEDFHLVLDPLQPRLVEGYHPYRVQRGRSSTHCTGVRSNEHSCSSVGVEDYCNGTLW
jgi:hypothetical protein